MKHANWYLSSKYWHKKPKEKIKLIYTSTPWRGLAVLVRAVERLNETRKDFEVDVYSSTEIYGEGFTEAMGTKFEEVFSKSSGFVFIKNCSYAVTSVFS